MSEERDKRDRREMEDEVAASLDMQAMTERAKRAEARVKELEPALEFVSELNRLDGDEAEGVKEILSKPKFWATEYAHAMGQLASVMDVDERRVKAEAEVEALRAEVERLKSERDSANRGVARNAEKAAEMMRERDEARVERDAARADASFITYWKGQAGRARADRDRLREALKEVHEWVEGRDEAGCLAAVEIIDRALASGEESR